MGQRRSTARAWAVLGLVLLAAGVGAAVAHSTGNGAVLATVTIGPNPRQVAVDGLTGRAFVIGPGLAGQGTAAVGTVSVLDTRTNRLLHTIAVGGNPSTLVIDTRRQRVFVGDTGDGTVRMLDARSGVVVRTLTVGPPVGSMAVDERTARLFVPNPGAGTVSVVDTSSGATVATVTLGNQPQQAVVDEQTGRVFVTNGDGHVSVLDAHSGALQPQGAAKLGPTRLDIEMTIAVSQRTGRVFVADPVGGTVSMLDGRSGVRVRTIAVGTYPTALAVDEHTRRVFVGNRSSHTITVLDARTGARLYTVSVPSVPMDLTVDPHTDQVLVTTSGPMDLTPTRPDVYLGAPVGGGSVDVLDGRSGQVLRTIQVEVLPVMTAVDPATGRAFVVNSNSTSVPPHDGWGSQTLRALKRGLPWLPIIPSQAPSTTHGSVSVFDSTHR